MMLQSDSLAHTTQHTLVKLINYLRLEQRVAEQYHHELLHLYLPNQPQSDLVGLDICIRSHSN